MLSIIKLYL